MRIALRQEAQQSAEMADAMQREGAVDEPRRARAHRLHGEGAEMLLYARAPQRLDAIARLQHGAQRAAGAAAHQAGMAAMPARHQLQYDRGLAMALDADDEPFVPPLHAPVTARRDSRPACI